MSILYFPRMESTGQWQDRVVEWDDFAETILKVRGIPASRQRWTGSGKGKRMIPAKSCAPAIAPYYLEHGERRSNVAMAAHDQWGHLIMDLDALPLLVDSLLGIVDRAMKGIRYASWTTWSCRDGYASCRVLLPLSRISTLAEASALWWHARALLQAAGLPESSAKPGEPGIDPRMAESRLYYLPSVPASRVKGDEAWGGTYPKGRVAPSSFPCLDVDALLPEAQLLASREAPAHRERYPSLPTPTLGKALTGANKTKAGTHTASSGGAHTEYVDFATVATGEADFPTLKDFLHANLEPGEDYFWGSAIGVERAPGDGITQGKSCHYWRGENGGLTAYSFATNTFYVDQAVFVEPEYVAGSTPRERIVEEPSAWSRAMDRWQAPHELEARLEAAQLSPEGLFDHDLRAMASEATCPPCPRRITLLVPQDSGLIARHMPCDQSTCPNCGPRRREIRAIAAHGYVADRTCGGGWRGVGFSSSSSEAPRTLTRASSDDLFWMGVQAAPGEYRYMVFFRGSRPTKGALGRLLHGAMPLDLGEDILRIARSVDLDAWGEWVRSETSAGRAGRVSTISAPKAALHQIVALADDLMGISHRKAGEATSTTISTKRWTLHAKEVVHAMQEAIGVPLEEEEAPTIQYRSGADQPMEEVTLDGGPAMSGVHSTYYAWALGPMPGLSESLLRDQAEQGRVASARIRALARTTGFVELGLGLGQGQRRVG